MTTCVPQFTLIVSCLTGNHVNASRVPERSSEAVASKPPHLEGEGVKQRSKKVKSQSLLLPRATQANGAGEAAATRVAPANGSLTSAKSVGSLVDVKQQGREVLMDGKVCKQFLWVRNQLLSPKEFIPKVRSEANASASIMSSSEIAIKGLGVQ